MNGIINVLKPPGMTSHDVVSHVRRILGIKKVGHTGTLDPEAAGVLPVCIGKATKSVQYITEKQKHYRANIRFGKTTDTYDSYGKVIRDAGPVEIEPGKLAEILKSFEGTVRQKPPIYSALKVNGKKLYQYALEGKEAKIESRLVEIYELKLVDMPAKDEAMIDVLCSKGTYIRSLCHDIGEVLGCGAHMSQLIRLASFPFLIEDSYTLEEIEDAAKEDRLDTIIKSTEILFKHYKAVTIKASALSSVLNGSPLYEKGTREGFEGLSVNEPVRIHSENGFIGIGSVSCDPERERKYIRIKSIFA